MDTPQNIQIISDAQGQPAFVVIPYADYMAGRNHDSASPIAPGEAQRFQHALDTLASAEAVLKKHGKRTDPHDGDLISNEVARRIFTDGMSPARAWREHLGLTQKEVAERMGVTQPTYNDMESGERKLRKASREKIAAALNIPATYLDL